MSGSSFEIFNANLYHILMNLRLGDVEDIFRWSLRSLFFLWRFMC